MKSIRERRNHYALFFAVSVCPAVWFGAKPAIEAAFAFGAISIVLFILLIRQHRLLSAAALIWDNRILSVPSAFISTTSGKGKFDAEETVVSTFGILTGSKIYRWGLDGVRGVRLNDIEIDRARMYLTFGDAVQTMRVELLHGMTRRQAVLDVTQKLWNETGVTAKISGWQHNNQGKDG